MSAAEVQDSLAENIFHAMQVAQSFDKVDLNVIAHAAAKSILADPSIAVVPSGRIEVVKHSGNGDLIARTIGTCQHIAIAHIGSQPHSFANDPNALALKAEAYAALAAIRATA